MEPRNLIRSRCCRCAPSASSRFDEGFDADQKKAAKEVKKSCNLNLAAAQLKLGNAVEARKAADKVRFAQCWYIRSLDAVPVSQLQVLVSAPGRCVRCAGIHSQSGTCSGGGGDPCQQLSWAVRLRRQGARAAASPRRCTARAPCLPPQSELLPEFLLPLSPGAGDGQQQRQGAVPAVHLTYAMPTA